METEQKPSLFLGSLTCQGLTLGGLRFRPGTDLVEGGTEGPGLSVPGCGEDRLMKEMAPRPPPNLAFPSRIASTAFTRVSSLLHAP